VARAVANALGNSRDGWGATVPAPNQRTRCKRTPESKSQANLHSRDANLRRCQMLRVSLRPLASRGIVVVGCAQAAASPVPAARQQPLQGEVRGRRQRRDGGALSAPARMGDGRDERDRLGEKHITKGTAHCIQTTRRRYDADLWPGGTHHGSHVLRGK